MSAPVPARPRRVPARSRLIATTRPKRPRRFYQTAKDARDEVERRRRRKRWPGQLFLTDLWRVARGRIQIHLLSSIFLDTLGHPYNAKKGERPPKYSPPKLSPDYAAEMGALKMDGQVRIELADALERGLITSLAADLAAEKRVSHDPLDAHRYRICLDKYPLLETVARHDFEPQESDTAEDSGKATGEEEANSRAAVAAPVRVHVPERPERIEPGRLGPVRIGEVEFRGGRRVGISVEVNPERPIEQAISVRPSLYIGEIPDTPRDILMIVEQAVAVEAGVKPGAPVSDSGRVSGNPRAHPDPAPNGRKANERPPENSGNGGGKPTVAVATRVDLKHFPRFARELRRRFPSTGDDILADLVRACQQEAATRSLPLAGITDELLEMALEQKGVTIANQRNAMPYLRTRSGKGTLVQCVANWMEQLATRGTVDEPALDDDPEKKYRLGLIEGFLSYATKRR